MAKKGAKRTGAATDAATMLVDELAPLGDIMSKSMFGGYGIFESGVMFVLIDTTGLVHLRADDATSPELVEAGGVKHGRMPYWSLTEDVLADSQRLIELASTALETARRAASNKKK